MRRKSGILLLTAMVLLGSIATTSASAAAPPEWSALQHDIAAPFPSLATPEGRFADYLKPRQAPWPIPSLGLGLIQSGIAHGDATPLDAGGRTIDDFVVNGRIDGAPGVFDHFNIASAYNVMREQRADHPLFAAHREAWETFLRRQPMHWLPKTDHYANKYMVEVVAVLESRRSGLTSQASGSAMAKGDEAERLALRILDEVAPTIARGSSTRVAGAPALVLSDPSNDALAYHALTLGFYGRAIELAGPRASARAREALQRVARASWALMAPDGDLAYVGRSQQQAWALALTAYGAEVAAADADSTWAPRFHAVADRALTRLRAVHGTGAHGFSITPVGAAGAGDGRHGLDSYASGPAYAGLTLTGLGWAIEQAAKRERTVGTIASDEPDAWLLGRGRTALNAVRTASSWFAVKHSRSSSGSDLRYDFGLVALKRPAADGAWRDVVLPRPHTTGRGDSAGPVLVGRGGRALPDGIRARTSSTGTVSIKGGYRSGHRWLSSGETFRFTPVECGVRSTFTRRAGGALEYSVFFRGRPRVDGGHLTADGIDVQASPRPTVRLRGGYASATDSRLTRAVLRFPASRKPVSVTVCG